MKYGRFRTLSSSANWLIAVFLGLAFLPSHVTAQTSPATVPDYVQADENKYLPAAIYLGGSGETLVRAINSDVVDLINRAEISSHGGASHPSGGVTIISRGLTVPPALPLPC